jgi:GTP pyrophosphokinase
MVAVLHTAPEAAAPEALAAWIEHTGAAYTPDERAAIAKAVAFARERYADLCTSDGEPWLDRALGTAAIVAGLKLDADSVRAALLLGVPHCPGFDAEALAAQTGAEVAALVTGVARMGAIRATAEGAGKDARDAQAENLRKMLLAMVGDIRVVLIKLAERTQALRFLVDGDLKARTQAARETQDRFSLPTGLSVWNSNGEPTSALRALEPETGNQIASSSTRRLTASTTSTTSRRRSGAICRGWHQGRRSGRRSTSTASGMRRGAQSGTDSVTTSAPCIGHTSQGLLRRQGIVHNL